MLGALLRAAAVLLGFACGSAKATDGLATLLEDGRCPVAESLLLIHDLSDRRTDRYLVLSVAESRLPNYVQCLFLEDGHSVLCEAASGYYMTGDDEPPIRLPAAARAVLATLGFDVAEPVEGNHQRIVEINRDADIVALADMLLTTLYRVYGARSIGDIEISAPLADIENKVLQRCPALS